MQLTLSGRLDKLHLKIQLLIAKSATSRFRQIFKVVARLLFQQYIKETFF